VEIADMAAGKAAAPASTGSTVDSKYPPCPPAPHRGRVASRHDTTRTLLARNQTFPLTLFQHPVRFSTSTTRPPDVNLKVLICRNFLESVHADDERTSKCK
jgi:hypothetical protein